MPMRFGSTAALGLALAGCVAKTAAPARVASALAAPAMTASAQLAVGGVPFELDERTGRPKASLILSLDGFPPPAVPGGTTLPACYRPFPAAFELGVYACKDKPEQSQALMAGAVEQDCYTAPQAPRTLATKPLTLTGCRQGILAVHTFEPPLRVDVEVRDVH